MHGIQGYLILQINKEMTIGEALKKAEDDKDIKNKKGISKLAITIRDSNIDSLEGIENLAPYRDITFSNCDLSKFEEITFDLEKVSRMSFTNGSKCPNVVTINSKVLNEFKAIKSKGLKKIFLTINPTTEYVNTDRACSIQGSEIEEVIIKATEDATNLEKKSQFSKKYRKFELDFSNVPLEQIKKVDVILNGKSYELPESLQFLDTTILKKHSTDPFDFALLTNKDLSGAKDALDCGLFN